MLNEKRMARIDRVLEKKQPNLQLFLDCVDSTQNISAIIRSADAVGILNLYYSNEIDSDIKVHKTITQGTHRWLDFQRIGSKERVSFLKNRQKEGFQLVVTHLEARSCSFREVDYLKPTVLIMGNEKEGVSLDVLALADEVIVVPMQGMAQSLNVSVATALILYEAERQREEVGFYEKPQLSQKQCDAIKEGWIYRDMIARRSKGRIR